MLDATRKALDWIEDDREYDAAFAEVAAAERVIEAVGPTLEYLRAIHADLAPRSPYIALDEALSDLASLGTASQGTAALKEQT